MSADCARKCAGIVPGEFSAFPADFRVRTGSPFATETTQGYEIVHQCLGQYNLCYPKFREFCSYL